MHDDDRTRFAEIMSTTLEVYGQTLTRNAVEIWWRLLEPFPLDAVSQALNEHLRESVYPPKPADVLTRLQRRDGHPDADEAWEIALVAMDEHASVVWTNEIAQAKSAADPIYEEGDKVGARMAFKARYERLLAEARQQGRTAAWHPSFGFDPHSRAPAIERAVEMGRLPPSAAQQAAIGHESGAVLSQEVVNAAKAIRHQSDE